MKKYALLLLAGCSGAGFNAIPQESYVFDAGPDVDASSMSDAMDVRDSSGDSSTPESATDAIALDMGLESDVQQDVQADVPPDVQAQDTGPDVTQDTGCTLLSHSNGLGQSYLDCAPLGTEGNPATYSQAMAQEAAAAWIGSFDAGWAATNGIDPNCQGGTVTCWAVIMQPSGTGAVWCFTGGLAGFVGQGACPTNGDATWN